jgi:DNA-binding MarR family transcriptional regulator
VTAAPYDDPVEPDFAAPDFGVLLAIAHATFFDRMLGHLADSGFAGFTTRTGFVLRLIGDDGLSLRELADRLEMSSPAALKVVDAMVTDGFVERVTTPDDRRIRRVRATDHGREALEEARRFHASIEQELAERIGAADAAAVRRGLVVLAGRASEAIPRVLRRSTNSSPYLR